MTRPYPNEYDRPAAIGAGARLRIRPIRPGDEDGLIEMIAQLTPEDRRLRFFAPIRGLSHELAQRFTRIDYDREMALIATPIDGDTVLGVARYAADEPARRAEFALAVRSDWHRRGLGQLLMTRLIEAAKTRGIAALHGDVLRENADMFDLCSHLGFTSKSSLEEPDILHLTLALSGQRNSAP
jgi:acetyltransferase